MSSDVSGVEAHLFRIDAVLRQYSSVASPANYAFVDLPDGPPIQFGYDVSEIIDVIEDDDSPWPFAVYIDEVWH